MPAKASSIRGAMMLLLRLLLLDGRFVGGDDVVAVAVDDDERRALLHGASSRTLQGGGGIDDGTHVLTSRLGEEDDDDVSHLLLHGGEDDGHRRLSYDVFEGDIIVTYEDVAINYGIDLADSLEDDGFVFAEKVIVDGSSSSSIGDDGGGATSRHQRLGRRGRGRALGLTSELRWSWNLPEYRRSDGRLIVPYAINHTSAHLGGETNDTIHEAMATIEKSTGVLAFVPRTNEASYVQFEYMENVCAATLGRRNPSYVWLGWCATSGHKGEMVHEIMHALGFWHEQSRPDRDSHVTIVEGNILGYALNNFAKQTSTTVNSLGSPYDYGSIMHYPPWAFQKSYGLSTIVPTRPLERWEVMGQCGRMSPSDVTQLRAMYQCSTGPRNLASIAMDDLCTASCRCWAYAPGTCDDDSDCMGGLTCGTTPSVLPVGEEYLDQLPPYPFSDVPTSGDCLTSCHASCCRMDHNKVMCPETCDTAPPVVDRGPMPRRMCLPRPEAPTIPPSPTNTPTNRPTRGVRCING
jgi:hypothetical protein